MASEEQQQRHYDHVADRYDEAVNFGLGRDNRNHRKKWRMLRSAIDPPPNRDLLEVGCGTGIHGQWWEREFEYVGVDLSAAMLAEANTRLDRGVTYQSNAAELPFERDHFGATVGTAVLHHMPDVHDALAEWVRVTAPGGHVALIEPNWVFPKDLANALTNETERGSLRMRPGYLRRAIDSLDVSEASVERCIYTPPWPAALHGVYDVLDAVLPHVPLARRLSIQLLVQIRV